MHKFHYVLYLQPFKVNFVAFPLSWEMLSILRNAVLTRLIIWLLFTGFSMVEQCFYNEEDDDIDESCLQIDCNNRKTEEAMSKLSIENEKDDLKSCS